MNNLHEIRKAFKKGDKVLVKKGASFVSEHFDGKECTVKKSHELHVVLEEEATIYPKNPDFSGGVWKDEITLVK